MNLDELIKRFLDQTGYLEDEQVQAIVIYGSRIRGNYKETSDLDVLVITKRNKNCRIGFNIDGIKIDCNLYSADDLFDIAYDKRISNNSYFESVLKTGLIIKNTGILEELDEYLEEINDIRIKKGKIPLDVFVELKDMYDNFMDTKADYWYFNILEVLRMSYNFLKRCSYISMVKVYDFFSNSDFYEEAYSIRLPEKDFISLFLEAITVDDFNIKVNILNSIMISLGLDINRNVDYINDKEKFLNVDEIKQELLTIYNKVEKVMEFLKNEHPYANYSYSVLLRQMNLFYQSVYRSDSLDIDMAINSIDCSSNEEKIDMLKRLFGIIDKDYRFDYENYMLKLKL